MKKLTTLIVVLAAGAVGAPHAAASPESTTPRVTGGGVDEAPDVGWIAALTQRGRYVCSGSLVSPRFVLTAAHCTRGTHARDWGVRLESKDRTQGGVVRRVRRTIEFPGYRPALDFGDIALLRLRRPVTVEPVRLVSVGTRWVGEAAYVAGWGQIAARALTVPRLLRSGFIPIQPDRVCSRQYGFGFLRGAMLCAGTRSVSACMGDSGGPLARRIDGAWHLVGVTSFGGPGCDRPGGYAWVGATTMRRWLRKRLGA